MNRFSKSRASSAWRQRGSASGIFAGIGTFDVHATSSGTMQWLGRLISHNTPVFTGVWLAKDSS